MLLGLGLGLLGLRFRVVRVKAEGFLGLGFWVFRVFRVILGFRFKVF